MRLILQRVKSASVHVSGEVVATIGHGILVFVGIEKGDGVKEVDRAARKLGGVRIFEDDQGRMNRDTVSVGGSILLVSQFTLAGSLAKGRRPSFEGAAPAAQAEPLIEALADRLANAGQRVLTGKFGADMEVELINDGPVTFVLDVTRDTNT